MASEVKGVVSVIRVVSRVATAVKVVVVVAVIFEGTVSDDRDGDDMMAAVVDG